MTLTIAVEKGLEKYAERLRREGFRTIDAETGWDRADAIVASGLDPDSLGIQNTATLMPVVDASGRTPDEVARRIREEAGVRKG